MAGFGEDLRAERERRGVTLATLCAQTKVKLKHLEALEQGDYSALPGGIVRRGIVRAYCASLGLEEEVWFTRFEADYEAQASALGEAHAEGEEAWVTFAENIKRNRSVTSKTEGIRWAVVIASFVALLVVVWGIIHLILHMRLRR